MMVSTHSISFVDFFERLIMTSPSPTSVGMSRRVALGATGAGDIGCIDCVR